MKKALYFITGLIIISLIGLTQIASAQINNGGTPKSFQLNLDDDIEIRDFQPIDVQKATDEDLLKDAKGELYRYGLSIPVGLNIQSAGTWTTLSSGRIWRLKIKSKDAIALGVYFDDFWLPEGGELFLYNEDKSQVLGAFTEINNHPSGIFAIELVQGETVTLEYFEPSSKANQAIISISEISYAYRSVNFLFKDIAAYGDSEWCEVDANCSEGDSWRDQQRGVARISVKHGNDYGWCSGSLVNNTLNDSKPYFLTADHCADGASVADVLAWVFYFNYERVGCNNTSESEPVASTITGATKKARGGWNGSDFYLVLFTKYVPMNYDVFYNGWKKTNVASPNGVSIHHPAGDVKKISAYTSTLSNYGGTHWSVGWSSTVNGYGVTEGGSSGSPIFNGEGHVIGTLTGGGSFCNAPTAHDIYGKFSYSWASNGSNEYSRLKDWLDPINAGFSSIDGINQADTGLVMIVDFYVETTNIVQGTSVHFTNLTLTNPAYTTTYLWQFEGVSGSATTIVNSPNRTFNTPGSFPVTLTATNSNGETDSKTITINVASNSVDEIDNNNISIYPNPANNELFIAIKGNNNTNTFVNILNMTGQIIYSQTKSSNDNIGIDISAIPSGMYFIKVETEKGYYSKKLSIIR